MDRFKNKNMSTVLIVVLVVINLALLGTLWYKFLSTKQTGDGPPRINYRAPGIPDPGDRTRLEKGLKRFLAEELNFSADQQNQFIALQRKHLEQVLASHRQINELRKEMMDRLIEGKADLGSIDRIAEEIGIRTVEHEKTVPTHFIELSKICNEEQKVKYWKLMHRISEQLNPRRGGPGGKQPPPKGQRPGPRGDGPPRHREDPPPEGHRPPPPEIK